MPGSQLRPTGGGRSPSRERAILETAIHEAALERNGVVPCENGVQGYDRARAGRVRGVRGRRGKTGGRPTELNVVYIVPRKGIGLLVNGPKIKTDLDEAARHA